MRRFISNRPRSLLAQVPVLIATVCAGAAIEADDRPAAGGSAAATASASALEPAPAAVVLPAVTEYPQVSMAAFTREYRSRPLAPACGASDAVVAIEKALDRRDIELHFSETSLRDVVDQLRNELKLTVGLDVKALEEAGVDLDMPITFSQSGTSLRSALNRMLGQVDLAFTIADESLVLTSKEAAWERPVVRLYPLPWGIAARAGAEMGALLDLVVATVEPNTWDANGGLGAIRPVDVGGETVLVVSQTQETHARIEGLLRGLHQRAFAEFGDAETPRAAVPVCRVLRVSDAPTRAALAEKLVDLCNASLGRGGDPDAHVDEVGESLVVRSVSPEFHALAARMAAAVTGVVRHGTGAFGGATQAVEGGGSAADPSAGAGPF